jgi:hypothetical protein
VKDRYSPEPLNSFTDMRAIARQEVMAALSSGGSLASMSPGTVPFNAVILPFVTELPVVGNDGDEIRFLADDENGVVWHLRYRAKAPSDYRWEYIGGPRLYAYVATSESTSLNTYDVLATPGPSITLPAVVGDWDITVGSTIEAGSGALTHGLHSYDVGGTAATDADGCEWVGGTVLHRSSSVMSSRKTDVDASAAVVSKYRSNTSNAVSFYDRWISITPVRVGRP